MCVYKHCGCCACLKCISTTLIECGAWFIDLLLELILWHVVLQPPVSNLTCMTTTSVAGLPRQFHTSVHCVLSCCWFVAQSGSKLWFSFFVHALRCLSRPSNPQTRGFDGLLSYIVFYWIWILSSLQLRPGLTSVDTQSFETFTFQITTFFLHGCTITFDKSLTARCCKFQGFAKWNMFIPVDVAVLQQLLRAKNEVSSCVLIR